MPTSSWIDLERVRNTLKGQPNDGSRGAPVAWKKDSDPAVAEDASTFWVLLDMLKWGVVSSLWRYLVHHLYPTTRCFWDVAQHPGVRGMVALTIDDCFCRQSPPEQHSMIGEVQALLKKHNAKATFFTTLCYSQGKWRRDAIKALLADGHQLANHGEEDREYDRDTAQEFERALDSTDEFIFQMANHEAAGSGSGSGSGRSDDAGSVGAVNGDGGSGSHRRRSNTGSVNSSEATSSGGGGEAPPSASNTSRRFRGSKWFRAPSASLSQTMSNVLKVSAAHIYAV